MSKLSVSKVKKDVAEYILFADLLMSSEDIDNILLLNIKSSNYIISQHCELYYMMKKDPMLIHKTIKNHFINVVRKM